MLDRLTVERLQALSGDAPLIVAASGGGDSTALLHLLADALGGARLRAVVVDHALRAGSTDDARAARAAALELAGEASVVTLTWPGGVKRSQQAARDERYRALCAEARRHGARAIALAHTLDDQAETVMMRAASGSRWRGLTGMAPLAPAPLWPDGRGLWLARPLLNVRRAALRDLLRAQGAAWIEDPANANPAYERVRVRARLAELQARGVDLERIADLARALRPFAERLDSEAAALVARAARFEGERIVLRPEVWIGPGEVRLRALSALIAAASGAQREPGRRELERLEPQLADRGFRGAALGGAVLVSRKDEVQIVRDRGALEGRAGGAAALQPMSLPSGVEIVWDGRLELRALEPGVLVAWDGAEPVLQRDGQEMPLRHAGAAVEARWLLRERVEHLLQSGN